LHDIFLSILLGIIEGLTEFLPVSSTAHLRIVELLFKIPPGDSYWKMYSVVIQLGAVLCLPTFFWSRIIKFIRTFPRGERGDRTFLTHPLSLVMIGFVCTAIPAFLLKKLISANLENFKVIGGALVIGGAIMWAVDVLFAKPSSGSSQRENDDHPTLLDVMKGASAGSAAVVEHEAPPIHAAGMEDMSIFQAVWIGLIQTLAAVFPGTSRSMATIAAGQVAGLSRAGALEFSFFLSIPTMFVACLYDLYKTIKPGKDESGLAPLHMTTHGWIVLLVGFVVSYIVALGVVAWFMHWVRRRGFVPFAIYRIIFGIIVLLWLKNA
jgi:undecaprenyl-diphosphatase